MYGCHTLTDILACALYVFPLVQLHQGVGVGGRAKGYAGQTLSSTWWWVGV